MSNYDFDIIDYICGLTDFNISKSVATNIALKRKVIDITDYEELTQKDNDLITADLLVSIALRPTKTASHSQSHGGFSESIGSEEATNLDDLLDYAKKLYKKWGEEVPELIEDRGNLQWLC